MHMETPMTRGEALSIVQSLAPTIREAVALLVETQDAKGDYRWASNGEEVWEDDVHSTLNALAALIRGTRP
jgi:hypothetical protein